MIPLIADFAERSFAAAASVFCNWLSYTKGGTTPPYVVSLEAIMVDRAVRNGMAEAIRSYMNEESTAFALDEALSTLMRGCKDETAGRVAIQMWFHYDGIKDHKIVAGKEEWDYFNRILLLLDSGAELEISRKGWRWTWRTVIASAGVIAFGHIGHRVGFTTELYRYTPFFGVLSIPLAWSGNRADRPPLEESLRIPFPSVGSMLSVRRSVAGFRRRRFPKGLEPRRIRSRVAERAMWVPSLVAWLLWSPVVLLGQSIPERVTETRILLPEARPT